METKAPKPRNPRTILRHVLKCERVPLGNGYAGYIIPDALAAEMRAANERPKA